MLQKRNNTTNNQAAIDQLLSLNKVGRFKYKYKFRCFQHLVIVLLGLLLCFCFISSIASNVVETCYSNARAFCIQNVLRLPSKFCFDQLDVGGLNEDINRSKPNVRLSAKLHLSIYLLKCGIK
jgi:hypothetical protein